MSQVLIRNIDPAAIEKLKNKASRHGRSLQAELKDILERAARTDVSDFETVAGQLRRRLEGRVHTDSADIQAQDRSR